MNSKLTGITLPILLAYGLTLAGTRQDATPKSGHPRAKEYGAHLGVYSVKILESTIPAPKPGTGSYWGAWGTTLDCIANLSILRANKPIIVPRSSFSDLSNVHQVRLKKDKNGAVVEITGGDASEGYYATITVANGEVVRRSVHWGEFPDNSWEETRYHRSVPPDQ